MSHRSPLTPEFREFLIRQLVYFSENRYGLADHLLSSTPSEKNEIKWLLQRYEERVEKIVSGFQEDLLQFRVLIGSRVLIRFEEDAYQESYTIVLPKAIDLEHNCISCLSPLGRSLLLAKCGDRVAVQTPEGDYMVSVLDNTYEHGQLAVE